jgi:hypothetical protein
MELRLTQLTEITLRNTVFGDSYTDGVLPDQARVALDSEAIILDAITDTADGFFFILWHSSSRGMLIFGS